MSCHPVSLLGRQWINKRLNHSAQNAQHNTTHNLEPLEPRVLFSANTVLPELLLFPTEPDTVLVSEINNTPNVLLAPEQAQDASTLDNSSSSTSDPSSSSPDGQTPYGATYRDTSEFLLGDVWVTVVLTESNGSIDPNTENWTASEIASVKSEVLEGLSWWENTLDAQGSKHSLDFFVDFTYANNPVATDYEPIARSQSQESLWINDFLDAVGYNTASSHFVDLDKWNHDQRVAHSTDWAYTVFIADSSADTDGKFTNDYFAYAYLGGPYLQMTSDNGGWGLNRLGQVLAHETGHVFYALDEYPGGSSYTSRSGYYNTQNLNAADGHPNPSSRKPSIMAEASSQNTAWKNNTSAPSTLAMLGWQDSDNDGIFDVLDVPLTLEGSGSYNQNTGVYRFNFDSSVNTLTNQNPRGRRAGLTINTVDQIQYRLNGGNWINGNTYGDFEVTNATQNVSVTSGGNHTIQFRTIVNETGLASNIISDTFTNTDNDNAGITVNAQPNLTTSETGDTASFGVKLNSQPTANVTLAIASNDLSEGTVNKSSLTFTPSNWNQQQNVTITGVNDTLDDGNITYSIITGTAVSNDNQYHGINPANLTVTNTDNDNAGITINAQPNLTTSETGDTASFGVKLNSQPTANVTLAIASNDLSEGTVNKSSLTFTPSNWNQQQNVTITGVNDTLDDGNITYSIITGSAVSNDSQYHGINPANLTVTNTDNDNAGITINAQPNLTTSETGDTTSFGVKLNSQPTANVTLAIASNDLSEGTVNKSSLTFTPNNWNQQQNVTITGVNDTLDDGNITYSIITGSAVSNDSQYHGINPANLTVTNTDNDNAGITINAQPNLTTSETGDTASFGVKLNSQPTANVTLAITSSDFSEGIVNKPTLTFTPNNWNQQQNVTITGVNDTLDDGNITYSIITGSAVSNDSQYHGINPANLTVTNTDNDNAGITINAQPNLTTSETGDTASFGVKLNSQPTANVTLAIASNDLSEGTVNKSSLTFTPNNWNQQQNVTITGVNDTLDDGNITYSIITGSAVSNDSQYHGINPANLTVTNTDNDNAGITINAQPNLTTSETGDTASFGVKLNSQPTANVTLAIASNDLSEGTVNKSSLTFTPNNWNQQQNVTITGVNDTLDDGNITYSIITGSAVSNDSQYHGINPANLTVTNTDNDNAGITINAQPNLTTSETGSTASFGVKLNSQPTANVTLAITSSDFSEGIVNKPTLTFTPSNWHQQQNVTIIGIDDPYLDNDMAYTIIVRSISSNDPNYQGLTGDTVAVTNLNDDFVVTTTPPSLGVATHEQPTSSSVVLNVNVVTTGNENPQIYVVWGTTDVGTNLASWTNTANLGTHGSGEVSTELVNLDPATTYFFRFYATNSAGTAWTDQTGSFTTAIAPTTTVDETGLIAHWKFDETNSTTVTDSSPFGENNAGSLIDHAIIDPNAGRFDGAVILDGTDDRVTIPDSTDINLTTVPERTISLWFQADDVTINSQKQMLYEEGGTLRGLNIYVHDGNLYVGGWNIPSDNESGWNSTFLSTDQIQSGQWHHVALVLNGTSTVEPNVLTGFLDGVAFATGEGSQLWAHSANIGIGSVNQQTWFHDSEAFNRDSGHHLTGKIDDARIYNRVLNKNEIQALASTTTDSQTTNSTESSTSETDSRTITRTISSAAEIEHKNNFRRAKSALVSSRILTLGRKLRSPAHNTPLTNATYLPKWSFENVSDDEKQPWLNANNYKLSQHEFL